MKIKAIDKLLLILLALVLVALGVLLICMALGVVAPQGCVNALAVLYSGFWSALILGVVGALILILTFRVLIAFLRKPQQPREQNALVSAGEFGSTYISYAAIDAMVQRHCKGNAKIKECQSSIMPADDGVTIALKLMVQNDVAVPQLTEDLMQSLKVYVEQLSGITVKDIRMVVQSAPVPKAN